MKTFKTLEELFKPMIDSSEDANASIAIIEGKLVFEMWNENGDLGDIVLPSNLLIEVKNENI